VHDLALFSILPYKLFSDKPKMPTIAVNKYPFVGDEIEFTCTSQVQRWPVESVVIHGSAVNLFSLIRISYVDFKGIMLLSAIDGKCVGKT
jgi:hypothetical protein